MLTETLTPQKLPVLQDMEELFQLVSVKNRCIQQLPIEHASLLFLTCEHLEVKSSWKNLYLPVCMGAKTPQSTALCILSDGTLLPLITRSTSAAITCRWQEDSFLCSTPSPRMVRGMGKGRKITTTFCSPDGLCSKQEWCFHYKMETNTQLQEKSLSFLQLPTMFSLDKHFNPVCFVNGQ